MKNYLYLPLLPVLILGSPEDRFRPAEWIPDHPCSCEVISPAIASPHYPCLESSTGHSGIYIPSFLDCFNDIPDAGSDCSVTLFDDLPVDDNPEYVFDASTGSTGHCFLQLTKIQGIRSITQVIGFTASRADALLGSPVPGMVVDNSGHKYNASLKMHITSEQLRTEIKAMENLGSHPVYHFLSYNCVSYALGILNEIRASDPILPIPIPEWRGEQGDAMPQALYRALLYRKEINGPDSKNIVLNVILRSPWGQGPCH